MDIKSLDIISFNTIYKAFANAFADYEMQQNEQQLYAMLKRRGFDPGLSFAAFEKDQIVAFTFNGTGYFNSLPTAYDTGTGTTKEYRGRRLATKIFEYSIPFLKQAGIEQYLLEVLQHNTNAVSLYQKLGFEVTREFNYFRCPNDKIKNDTRISHIPYSLTPINIHDYPSISSFWDFEPSWQNSLESITRSPEDFISIGVFSQEKLIGYAIFEPASGDITQIAVDKDYRRKGVASFLLNEMIKLNKYDSMKIINTDIGCESITGFLKSKNIEVTGKQFEMIVKFK